MQKIIEDFLLGRKNDKIKKEIKSDLSEDEKQEILNQLDRQFSLKNWLPDAAKRASQLKMVSHPSKFSHPDAKTSSIIANQNSANDGYLRNGNVNYDLDVFGNAAALDVYKFLTLRSDDGRSVLEHLEVDSTEIQEVFSAAKVPYFELKKAFFSIKQIDDSIKTDRLVKQVYFPVSQRSGENHEANDYHLLSILTPSGLVARIKDKIDEIRFSSKTKEAKELRKTEKFSEIGFDDIFELTILGYGGTKPQNISTLNSQSGGRSYLLPCLPPKIHKRNVRLPNHDFFKNCLWSKNFESDFEFLNRLILDQRNNSENRELIAKTFSQIADQIMQKAYAIRAFEVGWSSKENCQSLPISQKIWLDDFYLEDRQNNEDWLDKISADCTRWVIRTYEEMFEETAVKTGKAEFSHIKTIIETSIINDQESFK